MTLTLVVEQPLIGALYAGGQAQEVDRLSFRVV